ncbi:essential MCU regulator, mitochondrial [Chelonus insularis]|uniref:essential MCU regulator, mitochondrial n=1 Tax=Chelonus insularis TaxID=460826 RepID=UPI00158AA340|nr:essential MCU regulator, mitochondrial [Chelonus insularis]XP_034938795.1 essential MCU regulator, mitochondrial [Chelonus insularis]
MRISNVKALLCQRLLFQDFRAENVQRYKTITTRSGAILPEPKTQPFGFISVICGVTVGLLIGATISKNIANFLEENDLFVPTDDDDDDD